MLLDTLSFGESCAKEPCLEVLNLSWPAFPVVLLRLLLLLMLSVDAVRESARESRAESCCSDDASLPSLCRSFALGARALVNARKSESIAALSLQWLRAMFFHIAAASL
jgi:hypothetical protein